MSTVLILSGYCVIPMRTILRTHLLAKCCSQWLTESAAHFGCHKAVGMGGGGGRALEKVIEKWS